MTPLTERYPDLLGDQDDPALLACVADLDATRAVFTLPPEHDAAIARVLFADAPLPGRPTVRPPLHRLTSLPWPALRWRLAPVLMAVLLVGSGLGVYLHGQSATPVNAQTVLHRAAAVTPGANEATHSTYRLSASGGYTGTLDVWVGTDASSAPIEFALTISMSRNGQPAPELSSRRVLTVQAMQVYDPASNTVTISSPTASDQQLEGMFVGALVAQKLNRSLAAGVQPSQFTLRQQTLDGVSVYALTFRRDGSDGDQTFYFNTQSYILEGADWTQGGRAWQARLDASSYHTMPLSAVPAHTFSLNAPTGAKVVREASPQGASKRPADDSIVKTAAAACNTTAQAFANALQAGDKSMLAICQETAPSMTAQQLVTALLEPFKATLDAQVASGALTRTQEADELAGLQRKLLGMVTAQPGSAPAGKHP
jgi:hypothetical protein